MYIIDTSVLIAILYSQDSNHSDAKLLFEHSHNGDQLYINELVYYEAITVLTYKLGIKAYSIINGFIQLLNIHFISSSRKEYGYFFLNLNKKVSIQDAGVIYDALE